MNFPSFEWENLLKQTKLQDTGLKLGADPHAEDLLSSRKETVPIIVPSNN